MGNRFVDSQGWVVVDRLLADMFMTHVSVAGSQVYSGTTLNEDQTFPAIRVQRLPGGGINADRYQDESRIEVVSWGLTRPQSDDLTAQVRQLMSDLDDGDYDNVSIDRVYETSGPGVIPDPNEELRAVPTTWSVTARRQLFLI